MKSSAEKIPRKGPLILPPHITVPENSARVIKGRYERAGCEMCRWAAIVVLNDERRISSWSIRFVLVCWC
jgi:hypothetical protein